MATRVLSQSDRPALLRRALRGNAVFSGLSGLAFILDAGLVASFLGLEGASGLFVALGVLLVGYGLALVAVAAQAHINLRLAWGAVVLDVLWVVGSVALLVADPFGLTVAGKWAVLIVADVVAIFALVQYVGIRRLG